MTEDNALPTPAPAEGDRETVEQDLLRRDSRKLADARPANAARPFSERQGAADESDGGGLPNPSQAEGDRTSGPGNAPGHQQ